MSLNGRKIAIKVALNRRKFDDRASAELYYENLKEAIFKEVKKIQVLYPEYVLDYSPDSLKVIEKIYFDYLSNGKFDSGGLTKDEFEVLLAIYYGQVYVANGKANWVVLDDLWIKDNRYYLAIRSFNGFYTIECAKWSNHENRPNNKRKQLIYREYMKYTK
ncbi:MAG: hypothetical protein AAF741_05730 [Bacteroidota bacterium]